ncbi:hypothetical protein OsI_09227 [Oryza sativa Indica Group]|uniref:Uncharacterized protein n=1 Tax=Oryza sativa subsp. indica TaxID=39946 RepID=B8AE23_ORYSI|nr:hypothetical protein OsI_09227 [Oryza sativa Indica Group]
MPTRRIEFRDKAAAAAAGQFILDVVDVVIGDHLYELSFIVEPDNGSDKPLPMDMENLDDGTLEKEEGNLNQDLGKESGGDPGNNSLIGSGGQVSERGGPSIPAAHLSLIPESDGLNVSDEEFDGLDDDSVMVKKVNTQQSLGEKLAAIPEAVISPSRKSKRRASDSDQLVLQRAEKLKADKNLDNLQAKGNFHDNVSFLQFTNEQISAALDNLGVITLGTNFILDDVINDLKSIEEKRLSK